jgi:hypothetical protein
MPEQYILALAKEYGQSPTAIENEWEAYWVDRALLVMQAEGEVHRREIEKMERARKR